MMKTMNQYDKNTVSAIGINAKNLRIINCTGSNVAKHQGRAFGKLLYGVLIF